MFVDVLILLGVAIAVGIPLWAIIDAARRPASAFQQIGSDKTRRIVIVVASIVYLASARPRLQKATSTPLDMGGEPPGLHNGEGSNMRFR